MRRHITLVAEHSLIESRVARPGLQDAKIEIKTIHFCFYKLVVVLRGGSKSDHIEARDWASMFLHEAVIRNS